MVNKETGKQPTQDDLMPSPCAVRTEFGKGGVSSLKGKRWYGMNCRDETDAVTHKPVGRSITDGFRMLDDGDVEDDS